MKRGISGWRQIDRFPARGQCGLSLQPQDMEGREAQGELRGPAGTAPVGVPGGAQGAEVNVKCLDLLELADPLERLAPHAADGAPRPGHHRTVAGECQVDELARRVADRDLAREREERPPRGRRQREFRLHRLEAGKRSHRRAHPTLPGSGGGAAERQRTTRRSRGDQRERHPLTPPENPPGASEGERVASHRRAVLCFMRLAAPNGQPSQSHSTARAATRAVRLYGQDPPKVGRSHGLRTDLPDQRLTAHLQTTEHTGTTRRRR